MQDALERPGESVYIRGVNQQTRLSDHLGQGRVVGSDDRCATSHGLQHRQPKAFIPGWEGKQRCQAVEHRQIRVVHKAREDDPVAKAKAVCQRQRILIYPPLATGYHQMEFCCLGPSQAAGWQFAKGLDETRKVLARLQGTQTQNEQVRKAIARTDASQGCRITNWPETGLDSRVEHGHAFAVHTHQLNQVLAGALRIGDDVRCTTYGPRDRALQVFAKARDKALRDPQEGEVVHGEQRGRGAGRW